jgi:Cu/Ag efflux pump CusA
VGDAMHQVNEKVNLPQGYRLDWGGEYTEYTASRAQLSVVLPLTLFLIFMLLFALYSNFKFPFITVLGVVLSAPVGTDSQRPFALVIVSGLLARLLISIFLMPALYALAARPGDRLEV